MAKNSHISLQVNAENKAVIKMIGSVSDWKADLFAFDVDETIKKGVTDAVLFIESNGGDAISGNKIANIIKKFPGTIDCEIGAICASAATYIAIHCKSRKMASNGQFMIHKPWGKPEGNEDEIKAQLKVISNITKSYKKTYAVVTGKTENEIEELWREDYWMDAEEALALGFITEIGDEAKITADLLDTITACGCPTPPKACIKPKNNDTNKQDEDMSKIALVLAALELPDTGNENDVLAEVRRIKAENTNLTNKVKTLEDAAKAEQDKAVKSLVDAAVKANKITEKDRARYEKLATANFDDVKAILDEKPAHVPFAQSRADSPATSDKYKDWTYEKYQKEAPEVLAKIKAETPEVFSELLNDYKMRVNAKRA